MSIEIQRQRKISNEIEITEKAPIKYIKIADGYEIFVNFIGCELKKKDLEEQLKFPEAHKLMLRIDTNFSI